MYDIYLNRGCFTLPDLADFVQSLPEVTTPEFQERLLVSEATMLDDPGFLGLNIPREQAMALCERLKTQGAMGQVLAATYRTPQITRQQAMVIAHQAIAEIKAQRYPTATVFPLRFFATRPTTWSFAAGVKELREQGVIPGAIMVDIDKVDGHVWTEEDYQALAH